MLTSYVLYTIVYVLTVRVTVQHNNRQNKMSEILITSKEITDTNKRLEASAGKVAASIWVSSLGVWVCNTSNASHRAWRGLGRRFNSLFEAREAYRSKAMRGIIEEAIREFSVVGGEA